MAQSTSRARTELRVLGSVLACLALVGCSGGEEAEAASGDGSGGLRGRGFRAGPVPVETDTVRTGRIARVVTVPGTVNAIRSIGVTAQLSVIAEQVRAEEGDRVEEGEILAVLDDREIAAQYRAAEAAFAVAEASLERASELLERGIVSQAEFEAERTAHEAARAQLDQLRTRVGFAEVRSPIGGVVTEKNVEAGDMVGSQSRLFTIAEVDTMVVRVQLSELDVVEVREGDPVRVQLDALPGRTLEGTVRRVFPAADPISRLIPVEIMLADEDRALARPGFLARASFELDPHENALLFPASALIARPEGEAVYVIEDATATIRSVVTGLASGGSVEVIEGLERGDRVVTLGANLLRDGAAVRDLTGQVRGGEAARQAPPTGGDDR